MIGTTISHFRILDLLGKGGMGEVYRAEDTTLDRQVAIKVLPELLAHDPERLARFEREAKLLATLNHPNIAAIYGLEEADGKRLLILELVEGETLAERIKKGPIPVEEALHLALQITEGLEAAHEKGIIHRDLKPGNIKLTPEGKIKILDFGLAKAFEEETTTTDASHSPTLTDQMTHAWVILGTAAYMSPEQAKGKTADKRADIFAFGAVLFEMLTGKRAFEGETITETLASVLKGASEWEALPEETPRDIRKLLRRYLRKDSHNRIHEIADARIEIKEALGAPETAVPAVKISARANQRQAIPAILASLVVGAAVAGFLVWNLSPEPVTVPRHVERLMIGVGNDSELVVDDKETFALSPDGSHLVYAASDSSGIRQLYLRPMDSLEARPLSGTDNGASPFFSPGGQWIGFFAGTSLKKVSITGGAVLTLCQVGNGRGGTWSSDDTIVYGPANVAPLRWVPAAGGEPQAFTTRQDGETSHRWPQLRPTRIGHCPRSTSSSTGSRSSNAWCPPTEMTNPKPHRTLGAITKKVDGLKAISKAALRFGDRVLVRTLNSTYAIQVLQGDQYVISGGWFDKEGISPLQTTINGCTFGGSAIKELRND